jgi:hypothetical protein
MDLTDKAFIIHYIDRLFEKDKEARDAALTALKESHSESASKTQLLVVGLIGVTGIILSVISILLKK